MLLKRPERERGTQGSAERGGPLGGLEGWEPVLGSLILGRDVCVITSHAHFINSLVSMFYNQV